MPNNPKPVILTQEGEQIFPLTDASLVAGLSTALSGKQDTISDLSTIRSGASAGATAYQKPSTGIPASDLASGVIPTVPTALSQLSDDSTHRLVTDTEKSTWNGKQDAIVFNTAYNASSNKAATMSDVPTVPTISTDIASDGTSDTKTASPKAVKTFVEGKGYGTYSKPSGGIPVADLASGVIPTVPIISTDIATDATSDTKTTSPKAVKTFVENKGYGTYSKPSGGIPAADIAAGVIPTVPTISTDIQTDKSSTTKTASPSAVYNEVHPAFGSSQPAGGMLPNVLYKLGTLTGTVSITFAAVTDANIENEYKFTFTAGSTAPTITWPAAITGWAGNCVEDGAPVITGGNYYEVSVMDGIALIAEVEA